MDERGPSSNRQTNSRREGRRSKKTQEKLAEALQVSVGLSARLSAGVTKVNLDTLAEIAMELGCDLSELVAEVTGPQERYRTELAERVR